MPIKQLLTRAVANIIFLLKKRELKTANLKFLIFTGTVGKTTLRDAVTYSLKESNIPVKSNKLGYSNELGILLTIFGYSEFSFKNPLTWLDLLKKKVPKNEFICIELGADFYKDIKWFLKKFTPFAVFISGIANNSWSRNIKEIFKERKHLLESVPKSGFIFYNLDDFPNRRLIQKSNTAAKIINFSLNNGVNTEIFLNKWSKNIFTKNSSEIFYNKENIVFTVKQIKIKLLMHRPVFKPQIYGIFASFAFIQQICPNKISKLKNKFENYRFSKDRLQIFKAKNSALIIEDSYKATPYCTYWFLKMSKQILARKKILIITEMRPLTLNTGYFYLKLANKIKFADYVYFLGPKKYFNVLKKSYPQIKHLREKNYINAAEEILKNSSSNDLILLKGSFRYHLNKLRNFLI